MWKDELRPAEKVVGGVEEAERGQGSEAITGKNVSAKAKKKKEKV